MLLTIVIINVIFSGNKQVYSQSLTNTVHKTQAASEKKNDLYCYTCHTMEDGETCLNITENHTQNHNKKCNTSELQCMVKRFSYTYSTENSTSQPKIWSLERRCTTNCEPGCIVIGERTKLFACISCCNDSLCNTGNGRAYTNYLSLDIYILSTFLLIYSQIT